MSPAIIAQLLVQFGLPLTQQIFTWIHSGKTEVTADDFAELMKLAQYRSTDSLTAAGLKIVDGKVVPL
jgi:hypothetical protein